MRYALSGKHGKACKRTRVISYVRIRHAICRAAAKAAYAANRIAPYSDSCGKPVQNQMAEVGTSVNMKSELGVSFHSDN